jgi:hypothetical protein
VWAKAARASRRRATDIDEVDRGVGPKRIQVRDDEVDRLDVVGVQVCPVPGIVPVGQDAAMDLGMEGDHPVTQDGGVASEVGDVGDRQPCVGQGPRGAARGDQIPAEVREASGELDHP